MSIFLTFFCSPITVVLMNGGFLFLMISCLLYRASFAYEEKPFLPLDLPECPIKYVQDTLCSSDGSIWVVGENTAVARLPYRDGQYGEWAKWAGKKAVEGVRHAYSIAEDKQGRIWVGTGNSGVCVWNGEQWQIYGKGRALLGEHVFDIAVSPQKGIVALATSGGLTLYNPAAESWSDFTRADGLPEDQIQTISFDENDDIWVGFQCHGIGHATAESAYRVWNYKKKETVPKGTEKVFSLRGKGYPSDINNAILAMTTQGAKQVFVGTDSGVARYSGKNGWVYVRGQNALDKEAFVKGVPVEELMQAPDQSTVLADDYITCMAQTREGLWIGFRRGGISLVDTEKVLQLEHYSNATPISRRVHKGDKNSYEETIADENRVRSILPLPDGRLYVGTYGKGLVKVLDVHGESNWQAKSNQASSSFPKLPQSLDMGALESKLAELKKTVKRETVFYMGEDWSTQGDWAGMYGRGCSIVCAADNRTRADDRFINGNPSQGRRFSVWPLVAGGPAKNRGVMSVNRGLQDMSNSNMMFRGETCTRVYSYWSAGGMIFTPNVPYPMYGDGPNLWLIVKVPEGAYELSLYFHRPRTSGYEGNDYMDFTVEVWVNNGEEGAAWLAAPEEKEELAFREDAIAMTAKGSLVKTRVCNTESEGVYKTFFLTGSKYYFIKINRGYSTDSFVNAVMLQKLGNKEADWQMRECSVATVSTYIPPVPQVPKLSGLLKRVDVQCNREYDSGRGCSGVNSVIAYYSRQQDIAKEDEQACRYYLHLWDKAHRALYLECLRRVWDRRQELIDQLKSKYWYPDSPNTVYLNMDELACLDYVGIDWKSYIGVKETSEQLQQLKKDIKEWQEIYNPLEDSLSKEKDEGKIQIIKQNLIEHKNKLKTKYENN